MIHETTHYFETAGREHTEETLKLAVTTARALGIKNIVLATTEGGTAKMMADSIDHEGITVTVVTHAFGQATPNTNPMSAELRRYLIEKGFQICTAAHALSGAERCLSKTFTGVYPVEIIAHTLRMFGQGTKVCVECAIMAMDADELVFAAPVVALGGTGGGLDTAMVITPSYSSSILDTKIHEILCKPSLK